MGWLTGELRGWQRGGVDADFADGALVPIDVVEADAEGGLSGGSGGGKDDFAGEFFLAVDVGSHVMTVVMEGYPVPDVTGV